ncbi:ornithine cyclodeaminase family protein [Halomarina halobia]|uniref:Ornithine cyclodeaminase family protein n=1 Tax=Halomarina halobia TaxID=3033386 RepID=A0ABD6ABW2_9EURY|nr:ornithine cyclodeaminase family protein [Halomarina sp. PSR21]
MIRVLSDDDVAAVLDLGDLLPVVADAFRKQGEGAVERPERPHFHVGAGLDGPEPLGTGLVMPAYVHGAAHYATKLVGVHEGNAERGLPTVNAAIALTAADTGRPAALAAGTRITNARTGCIGGLAARELANRPVRLGVLGAGAQARWQVRAIVAATGVERVRIYSPSESRERCAADLRAELATDVAAVDAPAAAVEDATVVVTATTATEPVFPGDALAPGALVVAVGAYTGEMQELDPRTVERAARVFADVPEEAAATGDARAAGLDASDFVLFPSVLTGESGRQGEEEILVVESVGSAVLDAAAAEHVLERAREAGRGTTVPL